MSDVRNPQQFERLYHGTDDETAATIMAEGLKPEPGIGGVIHATTEANEAWGYGSERVDLQKVGRKTRVIAWDHPAAEAEEARLQRHPDQQHPIPVRYIKEPVAPEKLTVLDRFGLNTEIDERKKRR